MKALIVEDNDTSSKLLQAVLEAEGFETRVAADGLVALKIMEQEQVDCVISDAMMPDMDGYRLAYRIKKNERLKNLPFIMYTSSDATKEDEELAIHLGINKYVRKPTSMKEMVRIIKELTHNGTEAKTKSPGNKYPFTEHYWKVLIDKLEEKIAALEITKKQLQDANKELDAFTYTVSHDLRSPLRGIDGYTNILKEEFSGQLNDECQKTFNSIIFNVRKMSTLIDELLDFSHLGKIEIFKSTVDLNILVNDVLIEQQQDGAITSNPRLLLADLGMVNCDRVLIKLALTNLISNAVKYSRLKQPPVIEIGVQNNGSGPVYYIKDNGVGFDLKYADKLFSVFQRFHTQEEFEGSGVGLAIVHRIITRHGGKVWADARVSEGATFYFTL